MPEFNESDHPRNAEGEFTSGGGSSSSSGSEYPWEEAEKLESQYAAASQRLKALSGGGAFNLTPEHIRATPEWQAAKAEFARLENEQKNFNGKWAKVYGKIPMEERMRRRQARKKNGDSVVVQDATLRTYDKDGRLHIARSHISKACVNPYYGREIPRSQALGLDPNRIYMMLRPPDELAKAAPTFARLPILAKHTPIDCFWDGEKQKKYIVGTIGSDVEFLEPFLDADVCIWDADAIAGIETEQKCEFSCGYSYEPIMTTGNYAGENYDGIMTQIQGNHLALVESGRAGPEVRAADSQIEGEKKPMIRSKLGNALIVAVTTAFPKVTIAADSELEKALAPATPKSFGTAQRKAACDLIIAMDSAVKPEQVFAVMDALSDVYDPEPKKKDNEEPEPAKDKRRGKDAKPEEHEEGCDCKDCKAGRDAKEDDPEMKPGKDSKEENEKAMDAKLEALRAEYREADQAKRDVRPVVGDVVAMDSAEKIYEFALDQMKVNHDGVQGTAALRALFNLAKDRSAGTVPAVVMDSASVLKAFPGIGRIRQA